MNSEKALEILREKFPEEEITENQGNPNIIGWWLFFVDGWVVYVNSHGDILDHPGQRLPKDLWAGS